MRLADWFSPARALGLLRAAHLIAATAAKYTAQYFLASSTSESRITPARAPLARLGNCFQAGFRSSSMPCRQKQ